MKALFSAFCILALAAAARGDATEESFKELRLGATRDEVVASLGKPEKEEAFPGGLCRCALHYGNLGIRAFIGSDGKVYACNINGPTWRLKSGIGIGDSIKDVLRIYGASGGELTTTQRFVPDRPATLIRNPENGVQMVWYDTGHYFWADAQGRLIQIRVSTEMTALRGQAGAPPSKAVVVGRRPELVTWETVQGREKAPDAISRQAALEDLAHLQEIIEQAYCGYDYFAKQGHDWAKTFAGLRTAIGEKAAWTPLDLAQLFAGALRFTGDRHFRFNVRTPGLARSFQVGRHQDAYFADVLVAQEGGQLRLLRADPKILGTDTWLVTSCEGQDPKGCLFRTLDPQSGSEAYLLGRLSEDPVHEIKVRLRSAAGQERELSLPLHRGRMAEHQVDLSAVFTYASKPFPVLQVTTFDIKGASPAARQKLEEFQASAARPEVRNSPYVLVDLRGNGGGQDIPGPAWLDELTNEPIKSFIVERLRSPLIYEAMLNLELVRHVRPGGGTEESFEALRAAFLRGEVPEQAREYAVDRRQCDMYESKVRQSTRATSRYAGQLLILYDAHSASGAEDFIRMARQFERAVTLGENSAGMCLYADCLVYYLPNSKITFQCGHKLIRDERGDGREGIGYAPDYWFDDPNPLPLILKNVSALRPHPGK